MCVVIDTDVFGKISNGSNKDFEPLRNWIRKQGHAVIHGGSEYARQLSKHSNFRRYLRGLERAGNRPHRLDNRKVDDTQVFLEEHFVSRKYNDHHIAAIMFVSGCRLISSNDSGLHELIKACCRSSGKKRILRGMSGLMVNEARIYQDRSHKSLLKQKSVYTCCV